MDGEGGRGVNGETMYLLEFGGAVCYGYAVVADEMITK